MADSPRPGITPTKIPRAPSKTASVRRVSPGPPPPLAKHSLIPIERTPPMKKLLLALSLMLVGSQAHAASFTVPSFTLSGPASTGTVCTPTAAASGLASAAPAGTVMFNCVVSPAGWVGGVSLTDAALQVVGLSGTTFNLSLIAAGVAQTYPAGSGTTTP